VNQLIGNRISGLPYGNLKLVNELMAFNDNPVLLHLVNDKGEDVIAYWVEFGEGAIRWLYFGISKTELYLYLSKRVTLKYILENLAVQYVFLVDKGSSDETMNATMLSRYEIPSNYIPGESSFFIEDMSEYYQDYLHEIDYHQNLTEQSYIIRGTPSDRKHSTYLSAKDGAFILSSIVQSTEGYVGIQAKNKYQQKYTTQSRVNKAAKDLKNHLTPLITGAVIHSFEIWVSMDTITLNDLDDIGNELKREVLEGYKRDVLDIDFTSEVDAQIICEKYNPVERKIIYGPIIDMLEDDSMDITISDKLKKIRNTGRPVKMSGKFKDLVLPPPTAAELIADKEKKKRLYNLVLSLDEGTDITRVSKKQILDNLLLFGNDIEQPFPIPSPLVAEGYVFKLKKPLNTLLKILEDGSYEIVNYEFKIDAKGTDIKIVKANVSGQFYNFILPYLQGTKQDSDTLLLINEYIDLEQYK
jgi:hypothetical protein